MERRKIFLRPEDYHFFLTQANECLKQGGASLLSYCLMPNHYHFLIRTREVPLGEIMQALQSRHALYFNRVHERVGHLFQDRFKSFEAAEPDYLEFLPVYINMNPVRAGLVGKPSQWEWSSHNEIESGASRFLDLSRWDEIRGRLPGDFRAVYRKALEEFTRKPEISASLDEVAAWAARSCGVSKYDLLRGGRGGPFTRAKQMLLAGALERGYTVTDVAVYLDCSAEALYGFVKRGGKEKGHPY